MGLADLAQRRVVAHLAVRERRVGGDEEVLLRGDLEQAVLAEAGEAIGIATNNVAEYRALIAGLRAAAGLGARDVEVRGDSQLLLRQMTGAYRVKHPALQQLWIEARRVAGAFHSVRFVEIRRTENAAADLQVNLALDAAAP